MHESDRLEGHGDSSGGRLGRIRREFAKMFASWGVELPDDDIEGRRRGEVRGGGWSIRYVFGKEGDREYLDVFAAHRMTNDRLWRIHEDGTVEMIGASIDHLPLDEEPAQWEERFYRMVLERGFIDEIPVWRIRPPR